MVVDAMEDIITAALDEIRPLPRPVEVRVRDKGLWGVLPRGDRMVLLMDFRLYLRKYIRAAAALNGGNG